MNVQNASLNLERLARLADRAREELAHHTGPLARAGAAGLDVLVGQIAEARTREEALADELAKLESLKSELVQAEDVGAEARAAVEAGTRKKADALRHHERLIAAVAHIATVRRESSACSATCTSLRGQIASVGDQRRLALGREHVRLIAEAHVRAVLGRDVLRQSSGAAAKLLGDKLREDAAGVPAIAVAVLAELGALRVGGLDEIVEGLGGVDRRPMRPATEPQIAELSQLVDQAFGK